MNMWLTVISSVVTVVSIICTIISILSAKKAGDYKDEVIRLKDAIEFKGLAEKYKDIHLRFLQETRADNWFKGKNVNLVVSPMESILASIPSVYPLMSDSYSLKTLVKNVSSSIGQFDKRSTDDRKKTFADLVEIENILQDELHKRSAKAVKQ